jgi:hypothetical protein
MLDPYYSIWFPTYWGSGNQRRFHLISAPGCFKQWDDHSKTESLAIHKHQGWIGYQSSHIKPWTSLKFQHVLGHQSAVRDLNLWYPLILGPRRKSVKDCGRESAKVLEWPLCRWNPETNYSCSCSSAQKNRGWIKRVWILKIKLEQVKKIPPNFTALLILVTVLFALGDGIGKQSLKPLAGA